MEKHHMNPDTMIPIIQDCIEKSELKLNSAQILAKRDKFRDAIITTVEAYEKAGRGDYLLDTIMIKDTVLDHEWASLVREENSQKQLISHYKNMKKNIEGMSDVWFTNIQKRHKQIFGVNLSRDPILERFQLKIDILEDVNNLKEKLMCADEPSEVFTEHQFNIIFTFVNFETRTAIAMAKFRNEVYSFMHTGNYPIPFKEFCKLDSFKNIMDLEKEGNLEHNLKQYERAQSFLQKI